MGNFIIGGGTSSPTLVSNTNLINAFAYYTQSNSDIVWGKEFDPNYNYVIIAQFSPDYSKLLLILDLATISPLTLTLLYSNGVVVIFFLHNS